MLLFISYAHEDKSTVDELIGILRAAGYDPWFDHNLIAGQNWQEQLSRVIEKCHILLAIISTNSAISDWCQWEIVQAVTLNKPIIPVLIGEKAEIPDKLRTIQYIDFTSGITPVWVTRLIRALQALHTPLLDENVSDVIRGNHQIMSTSETPFSEKQYFLELDKIYEKSRIEDWYVPLDGFVQLVSGEKQDISVDTYVDDWLLNKNRHHLAILGDYGSGKSWLCTRIAKRLADKYLRSPDKHLLPLLISFREYKSQMDLLDLIESELLNEYGVRLTNPFLLKQMLQTGKIILILDGMDEMAKGLGDHSALVAYSRLGLASEIPKAIVTCRTHYFYSGSEEREVLNPSSKSAMLGQIPKFDIIHLKLFDWHKIHKCIDHRFDSEKGAQVLGFIRSTYNLSELCSRPVLLSLVCDSYDLLPELRNPLSTVDLYEAYIDAWLRRELKEGRLMLDPETLKEFFENLAHDLVLQNSLGLEAAQLQKMLSRFLNHVGLSREQWTHVERQIVTSAFVRRTLADGWEFAHRSFQEFFYARKFFRWEEESSGEGEYAVIHVPIWQFIAEMALTKWNEEKALHWIKPTIDRKADSTLTLTTLRAAAAYWLVKRKSSTLKNYPLSGIMLDSVDLHELDFSGCDLSNSDFHNSDLAKCNLNRTNLRGSVLAGANLDQTVLDFAYITYAECQSTSFLGARIHKADFTRSQLQGACFTLAKLRNVNFTDANIHYTDFRGADFGAPESQAYSATMEQLQNCTGFATASFD